MATMSLGNPPGGQRHTSLRSLFDAVSGGTAAATSFSPLPAMPPATIAALTPPLTPQASTLPPELPSTADPGEAPGGTASGASPADLSERSVLLRLALAVFLASPVELVVAEERLADRKSVGYGKSVDFGGGRFL
eukprot:RCo055207